MKTFIAVMCCLMLAAVAADKAVEVGGVWCKVKGNSGKIELYTNEGKKQKVTIDFDSMQEYAADGTTKVGSKASPKHQFNSFSTQNFAITPSVNTTMQGLKVVTFNFTASMLNNKADLNIQTYMFLEQGQVVTGNEEVTSVGRGTLKFNVDLVWPFCAASGTNADETLCPGSGSDPNEVGGFVDLEIEIKSKSKPTKEEKAAVKECKKAGGTKGECKTPKKYGLGDGSTMDLSTLVSKNGAWENMADGYPNVEQKGSKNIITLRFPATTGKLLYDPTIDLLGNAETDNAAATLLGGAARAALLAFVMAIAAFLA